jgi:hypothetical protein
MDNTNPIAYIVKNIENETLISGNAIYWTA